MSRQARLKKQRQRRQAQRQRQRSRLARRKARQRERTRRQKARQEQRSRRALGRQSIRQERVKQKGASGYYTPQGIKARGDVAMGLVDKGINVGGMIATGGLSSLVPGTTGILGGLDNIDLLGDSRRDELASQIEVEQASEGGFFPSVGSVGGFGGFGGSQEEDFEVDEFIEEKPFYTNPLFIAGGLGLGFLLLRRRK
jgi:hypothetical protein